jgi:glutathione peroxidase
MSLGLTRCAVLGGLLIGFALVLSRSAGVMAETFKPAASEPATAYDHRFTSIDGKPMPLSDFRGKVLIVVNTASFCGFTDQYQGLQKVYQQFEAQGVVVIGVPSGDFGGQEYGTDQETKAFCEGALGVTFPLTTKSHVRGEQVHPFYAWAAASLGADQAPAWNFHKYLVGRDGALVGAFGTRTKPSDPAFIQAIERAVAQPQPMPLAAGAQSR